MYLPTSRAFRPSSTSLRTPCYFRTSAAPPPRRARRWATCKSRTCACTLAVSRSPPESYKLAHTFIKYVFFMLCIDLADDNSYRLHIFARSHCVHTAEQEETRVETLAAALTYLMTHYSRTG